MPNQRDPVQKTPRYAVHTRRKKRGRKKLIAALIVICILIAAAFLMSDYFVFTPEGIRFAWGGESLQEEGGGTPGSVPAITPDDDGPRISVDRGELPPEGAGPIRGALLEVAGRTREDILSAVVNLKNLGYTAAVVQVKPAERERISADELAWAAESCDTANLRLVAYVSCFRDDVTPRTDNTLAVHDEEGSLFIDYDYSAWLNPYEERARDMVLSHCRFAVSGGADELLLDNLCFPGSGNTAIIDYGEQDKTPRELIGAFAAALRDAVSVRLGAVMSGDDTFGEGASETGGQDVTLFATHFDRVWAYAADLEAAQTLYTKLSALSAEAGGSFCAILGNEYVSAPFVEE